MNKTTQTILTMIGIFGTGVVFVILSQYYTILRKQIEADRSLVEVCKELAIIRAREYEGTEYAGLDFYKSCIENVIYANPYNQGKPWTEPEGL